MLELTFCIETSYIFYLLPVTTVFTLFGLTINLTSVRNKDSSVSWFGPQLLISKSLQVKHLTSKWLYGELLLSNRVRQ